MGSTYLNAYEILEQVRHGINDYSAGLLAGTDTTGAYLNKELMRAINDAQGQLFNILITREPQLFYKSATLTPVSSVLTMPSDFYRMRRIEDRYGVKLNPIPLDNKRLTDDAGTEWFYYSLAGTVVFDRLSFTDSVVVYYVKKCRELDQGALAAGGTKAGTLASTARAVADYYNGMTIENVTAGYFEAIADYTAARVITLVTNNTTTADVYGLISDLPEEIHKFIAKRAILDLRNHPKSIVKPTKLDWDDYGDQLSEAIKGLLGTQQTDVNYGELFD